MSCLCVGLSQRASRESIRNPTAVSTARAPAPCRIRCRHGIARIRTRKDKGSPGPPPENEEDPGRTAGVLRIRCAALLRSEEIVLARTDLDSHEAVGFRYRLNGRILGERLAALGHLPGRRSRNPDAGRLSTTSPARRGSSGLRSGRRETRSRHPPSRARRGNKAP